MMNTEENKQEQVQTQEKQDVVIEVTGFTLFAETIKIPEKSED